MLTARAVLRPTALQRALRCRRFASLASATDSFSNVLDGALDTASPQFRDSRAHMAELTAELRARVAVARQGGGATARAPRSAPQDVCARPH